MANRGAGSTTAILSINEEEPFEGTTNGNYRLLGGAGYQGSPQGSGVTFTHGAPIAVAYSSSWNETDSSHPAYGSGMSEWCANCHSQYLASATKHPVSQPMNGQGANYNQYISTGNFTGTQATSWDPLVPFEDLTATTGADLNLASTAGPATGAAAQVMCLTCHRAHASAHNNAGRWDFETEYLADSHALVSPDVPASANPYYGDGAAIDVVAKYGAYQRSLCNKCHVQD